MKPRFDFKAAVEQMLQLDLSGTDPRDKLVVGLRDPASGFGGPHHRAYQRDQRLQRAIAAAKAAIDRARDPRGCV